jgi:hypothetical protein
MSGFNSIEEIRKINSAEEIAGKILEVCIAGMDKPETLSWLRKEQKVIAEIGKDIAELKAKLSVMNNTYAASALDAIKYQERWWNLYVEIIRRVTMHEDTLENRSETFNRTYTKFVEYSDRVKPILTLIK